MNCYTVTKPFGIKDSEFRAYVQLLTEIGVDLSSSPRVPEQGTGNRWLYVWTTPVEAERFARELQRRTGDSSWCVHPFETPEPVVGPVAPLDIRTQFTQDAVAYRLDPSSLERVLRKKPKALLAPSVSVAFNVQQDFQQAHGPIWDHIAIILTGLNEAELTGLGGYCVYKPDGVLWYQSEVPVPH